MRCISPTRPRKNTLISASVTSLQGVNLPAQAHDAANRRRVDHASPAGRHTCRTGRHQGAPNMGVLPKLGIDHPRHHLGHLHRHLAALGQLARGHQGVHVSHPVQLRRQEVRHVVVLAERGRSIALQMPWATAPASAARRLAAAAAMVCAKAGRRFRRQVRAARKPARCAASCTESENAMSFLSWLYPAAEELSHHHSGQARRL
jgi:hypothetical protein